MSTWTHRASPDLLFLRPRMVLGRILTRLSSGGERWQYPTCCFSLQQVVRCICSPRIEIAPIHRLSARRIQTSAGLLCLSSPWALELASEKKEVLMDFLWKMLANIFRIKTTFQINIEFSFQNLKCPATECFGEVILDGDSSPLPYHHPNRVYCRICCNQPCIVRVPVEK